MVSSSIGSGSQADSVAGADDLAGGAWVPPEIEGQINQRVGSSIIDDFVLGHSAADVLREIVQNEFDGGGSHIGIVFGPSELTITGSGRPIAADGWARLDVIVGTGDVIGSHGAERVDPKSNGIGSKNFGIRSLFFFGDRIHVRSNGRVAILDVRQMGTRNLEDPTSLGLPGVSIHVPYRTAVLRDLQPFDVEREHKAMDEIAQALLPTLVKLAGAGSAKGVTSLDVNAQRTGRRIIWSQSAKAEPSAVRGVTLIRRKGRLEDRSASGGTPRILKVEELEFIRSVAIPSERRGVDFPSYYAAERGRLNVAVSVPLIRRRLDVSRNGNFYYPLQAPQGLTGFPFSISAPFKLDQDRSAVVQTPWNDWLLDEAARLTTEVLQKDWLGRFGALAYEGISPGRPAAPDRYQTAVINHLRTQAAWPTQASKRGAIVFAKAENLVVAGEPKLDGFMGTNNSLDKRLMDSPVVMDLVRSMGAKHFTINALVRLRCAGANGKDTLATKLSASEADYHYPSFESGPVDVADQVRSAEVLSSLRSRLSPANRKDLRDTRSTLAADQSLAPVHKLTLVDPSIWAACPAPMSTRLHPKLADVSLFARMCVPFDYADWAVDACSRAETGVIDAKERGALYRWLLLPETKLAPRVLAAVRKSPVVRSHSGDWVRPIDLAMLPRHDAAVLHHVVDAPHADLVKRPELLERLSVRRKVIADDLIALARRLGDHPGGGGAFEAFLVRHEGLLKLSVADELAKLPCLRNRAGGLSSASELHLATPSNLEWLDDPAVIVADGNVSLYRRLGCRSVPDAATLLALLRRRRVDKAPPPRLSEFYQTLADALRRQPADIAMLAAEPVLYVQNEYHAPQDVIVAATVARFQAVTLAVFRGSDELAQAYLTLGAQPQMRTRHWISTFRWFEARAASRNGTLPLIDRPLLRDAYRRRLLTSWTEDLPVDLRFLLDRAGGLHRADDLVAGSFVEDDFPALATALELAGAKIAFADAAEESRSFFLRLDISTLSTRCGSPTPKLGEIRPALGWVRAALDDALSQIRNPNFALGLAELCHARRRQVGTFGPVSASKLAQRLSAVVGIDIVADLQLTYRIAGKAVQVDTDFAVSSGGISVAMPRSRMELEQRLAAAIAEIAGAARISDRRALSPLISLLLRCVSAADARSFLLSQGISPPSSLSEASQEQEDLFDTKTRTEDILRTVLDQLDTTPRAVEPPPASLPSPSPPPAPAPVIPPPVRRPPTLPVLAAVILSEAPVVGAAPVISGSGGRDPGYRGPSYWTPPSAYEVERDRMVGTRGEELIYHLEIQRVRELGYERPEEVVIWTSRTEPGADHDIRSIDGAGNVLWIEVKSTTGRDGRFEWSRREFEKAMREGPRYELVRVYEADSLQPVAKRFRNPAALQGEGLRLELSTLRAFVEPRS
ncbi:DUF3883 domain-containing protein [Caulobacter hibisci]|uniref:DUF3883 domain-containing protein n=1 Tax=Caulobacter hibisci TaxID=2035993 RepID=A0ABS0T5J7_9CAUL|nr:DUF3883 domain-containing protein [Caulobacter hibisci]MBI1686776.1 DUF3883 domain-containing protein [Caulobacter hibisci]